MPSSLPVINGPADVPELRQWLLHRTRPGGSLERLDGRFLHATMKTASLWWVEPETLDLLVEAAPTLPNDYRLDMATLPTLSGFAVFAHDVMGTDAATGLDVRVSAIGWGPCRLPPLPDGTIRVALGIAAFTRMALHKGLDRADLERSAPFLQMLMGELFNGPDTPGELIFSDPEGEGVLHSTEQIISGRIPSPGVQQGDLYAYIGRTDWVDGMGIEGIIPDAPRQGEAAARSMAEDRRLLGALWQIVQTPVVTTVRTKPPRHVARRSTRKGLNPEVRILRLGGPHRSNITTGTGTRNWTHQWVVRPHFRWQACGPKWSERKLILVGPYTKGPEGAPLLGGDRVWRVVAPAPPEVA